MEAERELLQLNSQAEALMKSSQPEAALPVYRRFVDRLTALFGPNAEDTLAGLNNLGVLLHQLHINGEAELVLVRALEGKRRTLQAGDPTLADTCKNLADVYRDTGRPAPAVPLYREALAYSRADKGATHPATIEIVDDLADCLEASDPAAALVLLRESLAAKRKRGGDNAPDTQNIKDRCVHLLRNVFGRHQEAGELEDLVGRGRMTSTSSTVTSLVRAVSGRNLLGGGGGGGGGDVLKSVGSAAGAAPAASQLQQEAVAWPTPAGGASGGSSGSSSSSSSSSTGSGAVTNPLVLASMSTQRASWRSLGLGQPLPQGQGQGQGGGQVQVQVQVERDPAKVFKRHSDHEGTWYVCEHTGVSVWELPPDCVCED
jgi:hypothetical protein